MIRYGCAKHLSKDLPGIRSGVGKDCFSQSFVTHTVTWVRSYKSIMCMKNSIKRTIYAQIE